MLGISLGVSSLIAMSAIVNGMENGMKEGFIASGGLDKVVIDDQSVPTYQEHLAEMAPGKTMKDIDALRANASMLKHISPEISTNTRYAFRGDIRTRASEITGVTEDALFINQHEIEYGRWFTKLDEENGSPVCVIGTQIRDELFGNPDVLLLDEPTNDLDMKSINWLQDFLMDFENTVIVVSHDRYFLNKVCTHIADVDFGKIKVYPGNYDFWYESSQLALKQAREQNKKKEEKIKELQEFIARFSANASKSKQATSRKKTLEKIELEEIKPSNRKYPYVDFKPDREPGREILQVKNISKTVDGVKLLDKVSFDVKEGNKIAFLADNELAKTVLFQIIEGEMEPDEGDLVC